MKRTPKKPLEKLADAAFRRAAQKVVEQAESTGTPVIVWEDDAIQKLKPRATRRTGKRTAK